MKKKRKTKPTPIHLYIDVDAYHAYAKEQEKVAKQVMKNLKKMGFFEMLADPNRK